jgi:molybdopterin-binding protein
MKPSARNQIPAKVVAITHGEAIANVHMNANGQRLLASITLEAVRELGIEEGSEVIAIVKASDVMVAVGDDAAASYPARLGSPACRLRSTTARLGRPERVADSRRPGIGLARSAATPAPRSSLA